MDTEKLTRYVASGKELKVMEVGSFSCAGLCACDPAPVVSEVSRIVAEERSAL